MEQAYQANKEQLAHEHQAQLRKINVIFDPQAAYYEFIDFEGLFTLLTEIKQAKEQKQNDYHLSQQEIKNLTEQLRQKEQKETELNKVIEQTNLKLANTEEELTETQTKLAQNQKEVKQKQEASTQTEPEYKLEDFKKWLNAKKGRGRALLLGWKGVFESVEKDYKCDLKEFVENSSLISTRYEYKEVIRE